MNRSVRGNTFLATPKASGAVAAQKAIVRPAYSPFVV